MYLTEEARYLGYATAFEIPLPRVHQPAKRVHDLLMLGSMPPRVRELYGLGFGPRERLAFDGVVRAVRGARRLVPPPLTRGYNTRSFERVARTERWRIEPVGRRRRCGMGSRWGSARGSRRCLGATRARPRRHRPKPRSDSGGHRGGGRGRSGGAGRAGAARAGAATRADHDSVVGFRRSDGWAVTPIVGVNAQSQAARNWLREFGGTIHPKAQSQPGPRSSTPSTSPSRANDFRTEYSVLVRSDVCPPPPALRPVSPISRC